MTNITNRYTILFRSPFIRFLSSVDFIVGIEIPQTKFTPDRKLSKGDLTINNKKTFKSLQHGSNLQPNEPSCRRLKVPPTRPLLSNA